MAKLAIMDNYTAARRGFPRNPSPGMRVRDPKTGLVFEWIEPEGGMGDLGFWGALLSAGVGLVGGLFGGGKKEKQQLEQAKSIIEQQQQQMAEMQAQLEKRGSFNLTKFIKKNQLFLVALLGALVLMKD
jgi:uncharacterized protein HemX